MIIEGVPVGILVVVKLANAHVMSKLAPATNS